MDEKIEISVRTLSGGSFQVTARLSSSVRALLDHEMLHNDARSPTSRAIFLHRGKQINPDLSLAMHGVKPNDEITVVFVKTGNRIRDDDRILDENVPNDEKQQRILFEEALRVSDVAFILLESSKNATTIYRSLIESQDESFSEEDESGEEFPTVIPQNKPDHVRCEPLPACWSEDSEAELESNDESDTDIIETIRDRCPSGAIMKQNCGNEW